MSFTALLKPFLPILVFIISVILVTEGILLKTDILGRRWRSSQVGWTYKNNKNVKRTLMWILLIYKSLGFTFKPSKTIREVVGEIVPKLPSQDKNLKIIMHSLEDHIYGGSELGQNDFKYYTNWIQFAKAHTKSR